MRRHLDSPCLPGVFAPIVSISAHQWVVFVLLRRLMVDGYQALALSDHRADSEPLLQQQAVLACRLLKLVCGTNA